MSNTLIDAYVMAVERHLRWRRRFEDRALREVRGHLDDLSDSLQRQGRDTLESQREAILRFGPPDMTAQAVVESNRGLTMMDWLSRKSVWVAGLLLLPAVALLVLSFLTFNFPCRESVQPGFQVCGVSFLQGLRPLLVGPESNLLLMGLKFSLTVLCPLLAIIVVIGASTRFDVHRGDQGAVATVALRIDRSRVVASVVSLIVLVVVLAYQLAS